MFSQSKLSLSLLFAWNLRISNKQTAISTIRPPWTPVSRFDLSDGRVISPATFGRDQRCHGGSSKCFHSSKSGSMNLNGEHAHGPWQFNTIFLLIDIIRGLPLLYRKKPSYVPSASVSSYWRKFTLHVLWRFAAFWQYRPRLLLPLPYS